METDESPARFLESIFKLDPLLTDVRAFWAEVLNLAPRKAYKMGLRQQWKKARASVMAIHLCSIVSM